MFAESLTALKASAIGDLAWIMVLSASWYERHTPSSVPLGIVIATNWTEVSHRSHSATNSLFPVDVFEVSLQVGTSSRLERYREYIQLSRSFWRCHSLAFVVDAYSPYSSWRQSKESASSYDLPCLLLQQASGCTFLYTAIESNSTVHGHGNEREWIPVIILIVQRWSYGALFICFHPSSPHA